MGDKVPYFIKTKQSENLKSLLTLQLEVMRQNMEYITTKGAPGYRNNDETTPEFTKLNAFFQDLSDLNVYGKSKKWPQAGESYSKAMTKLGEWKQLVAYLATAWQNLEVDQAVRPSLHASSMCGMYSACLRP